MLPSDSLEARPDPDVEAATHWTRGVLSLGQSMLACERFLEAHLTPSSLSTASENLEPEGTGNQKKRHHTRMPSKISTPKEKTADEMHSKPTTHTRTKWITWTVLVAVGQDGSEWLAG